MRAYGHLAEQISTIENFEEGEYQCFRRLSGDKRKRREVRKFRENLQPNLRRLLSLFQTGQYQLTDYRFRTIFEKKERMLAIISYADKVFSWSISLLTEPILTRTFSPDSYANIIGKGQHQMVKKMGRDIYLAGDKIKGYLSLDVAKMFASVPLSVVKKNVRKKIKDPHVLSVFDGILDSSIGTPIGNNAHGEYTGLPLGSKLSPLFANIALSYLDHDCRVLFNIRKNIPLVHMLTRQYITEKLMSVRSEADASELNNGVEYLRLKFERYLSEGIVYYYRFMDNIYIFHEDITFLHLLLDWIGLYLESELHLTVNPKWQVGNLIDGMNVVGYRIFADGHIRVNKANKDKTLRKIRKGRKMGLSDDQIKRAISSNIGQLTHANSINLLRKYGMETKRRLGATISKRKNQCPFEDMERTQSRLFEKILFDPTTMSNEDDKLMLLKGCAIIDSNKEFNDDGTPKPCLVIRYVWQGARIEYKDLKGKSIVIEKDQEYYSFTGSSILIEQFQKEFDQDDLPAPTVIQKSLNKRNKKFYKFT